MWAPVSCSFVFEALFTLNRWHGRANLKDRLPDWFWPSRLEREESVQLLWHCCPNSTFFFHDLQLASCLVLSIPQIVKSKHKQEPQHNPAVTNKTLSAARQHTGPHKLLTFNTSGSGSATGFQVWMAVSQLAPSSAPPLSPTHAVLLTKTHVLVKTTRYFCLMVAQHL